jgi:serine/threonine protein phosphatase PrpC
MSAMSAPEAVGICFAGQCDRGKVREENQDSIASCATPLGELLVVADGIGGFEGGGVASRLAVEALCAGLADMPTFFPPAIAIQEAASRANAEIAAAAAEPDSPNSRMGTTVVLALLQPDHDQPSAVQAWIGHIGDSRAYAVHVGRLSRITRDHTAVQLLLEHNLIAPEEAHDHPDASVLTRTLGREPNVEIELNSITLQPGDSLLLCSDGLWGYVPEPQIERLLADPALSAEGASRALLDLALDAGGHDNISLQIARLPAASDAAAAPARANLRESARAPLFEPTWEPVLPSLSAPVPEPAVDSGSAPDSESAFDPQVESLLAQFLGANYVPLAAGAVDSVTEPAPASVPDPESIFPESPRIEPGLSEQARPEPVRPELPLALEADPQSATLASAEARFESAYAFRLAIPLADEDESAPAQNADRPLKFAGLRARISAVLKYLADGLVSFAFPGERKSELAPALEPESSSKSKRAESRLSMSIELFASLMQEFRLPLERPSERDYGLVGDCAPRLGIVEGQVSQVSLFLKLLGILLVGFGTSCALVYFAVVQNWFGLDNVLR